MHAGRPKEGAHGWLCTYLLTSLVHQVADFYKIDSILTLVDCKHVKEHLDEVKADDAVNEAVSQIAFADRVLLNKTDLVTPEQLEEVSESESNRPSCA